MNGKERNGYKQRINEAYKNGQKWGELLERLRYLTESTEGQETRLQRIEQKLVAVNLKAGLVGLLGGFLPALGVLIYILIRLLNP